jgi:hypothetical protein
VGDDLGGENGVSSASDDSTHAAVDDFEVEAPDAVSKLQQDHSTATAGDYFRMQ